MIFNGFDTETDNREDGGHAVLLTAYGPDGGRRLLFPRSFSAIWEFMKGRTYVAWNAQFDSQAICHDNFIPYRVLVKMGRFKRADWKCWRFEYIPGKYLTVRKGRESFTLYDLKQFYGMSLKEAARMHLGPDVAKHDIPRSWYPRMVELLKRKGWRREKILAYADRDAEAVFLLCEKLLSSFAGLGLKPEKLISPASLTMDYFRGQLKEEPNLTEAENVLWSKAFYGGRVEVGTLGRVDNVALYDLHSAYPSVIAELRSLKNAELVESLGKASPSEKVLYGLYHLTADVPTTWAWGPLAVRDNGKVIYPVGRIRTWCCLPARKVLDRLGVRYEVHEAHEYVKGRREAGPIFSGIEEMYWRRKNPVLGLAVKLVLNSLYGKLCERRQERVAVGRDRFRSYGTFGRFTNYVLACHITETTRCRVFSVLHELGTRAHFAATDSVLIDDVPGLAPPTGPGLGEWDLKGRYSSVTILGCGRYVFEGEKGETTYNLRGFAARPKEVMKLKTCRRSWARISQLDAASYLTWAADDAAGDLNVLSQVKKRLKCEDDKRFWPDRFKKLSSAFNFHIGSTPWIVDNGHGRKG